MFCCGNSPLHYNRIVNIVLFSLKTVIFSALKLDWSVCSECYESAMTVSRDAVIVNIELKLFMQQKPDLMATHFFVFPSGQFKKT